MLVNLGADWDTVSGKHSKKRLRHTKGKRACKYDCIFLSRPWNKQEDRSRGADLAWWEVELEYEMKPNSRFMSSWLRGVFLIRMSFPAWCSGCQRPLIAGCNDSWFHHDHHHLLFIVWGDGAALSDRLWPRTAAADAWLSPAPSWLPRPRGRVLACQTPNLVVKNTLLPLFVHWFAELFTVWEDNLE